MVNILHVMYKGATFQTLANFHTSGKKKGGKQVRVKKFHRIKKGT